MKNARIQELKKLITQRHKMGMKDISINIPELSDLLDMAEYANKASYILDSMPVGMDDMLEDYDPDEET